jgi:Flp pilus assembly protein TadG
VSIFRRFRRDERGAAMVEFALVAALIFIPLVFGVVEFGRLIWAKNMVTAAAREGVRYAIVHGSSSGATFDSAAVANYVIGRTDISPIKVATSWTGAKDPQDTVTVTVRYDYTPVVKVPGLLTTRTVTGVSSQIIAF